MWLILLCGGVEARCASTSASAALHFDKLLTNISQVRALSTEEARLEHPFRIWAIVTFQTDVGGIFVHDLTNGIYVERNDTRINLHPGQVVELEGVTGPGDYAPILMAESVRVLDERPLPPARLLPFSQLASSQEDCQWIEERGVVRWISQQATNRFFLDLDVGGNRLRVFLTDLQPQSSERLLDAVVRVRGVRGCIFNDKRQVLAPLLFVNATNVIVDEPAPSDPFGAAIHPLKTLLQYDPNSRNGHRIKVRGAVTHQVPGQSVFIEDGNQGLRLRSLQTNLLELGDVIEALGFEAVGKYTPFLEDVVYRRVGSNPAPRALPITVVQALSGAFDADLVSIEGHLVGSVQRGIEQVLIMREGGALFNAQIFQGKRAAHFDPPPAGSLLRVSGICLVEDITESRSTVRPESFRILLRSPADVVVVEGPPWLTPEHVAWLLPTIVLSFLAILGGVIVRARLKLGTHRLERAGAEERFLAIMAERNRMAREIHDTLAQGYTAISAQLELLKDKVPDSPQWTKHLELARVFVRDGLAEARRSIWEMRSQALEQAGLSAALANVANHLTAGSAMRASVRTIGTPRDLPVTVENNLLRIGQEAITNAIKYAQPKRIAVELNYQVSSLRLTVRDNGCGFDSSKIVASKHGGLGLLGMRERAEQLGGRFWANSEPGEGTEIVVEVPVASASLSQNSEINTDT